MKLKINFTDSSMRWISILSFIIPSAISLFLSKLDGVYLLFFFSSISCGIMLLPYSRKSDMRAVISVALLSVTTILSIVFGLFDISQQCQSLVLSLLAAITIAAEFIRQVVVASNDLNTLISKVTGWEVVINECRRICGLLIIILIMVYDIVDTNLVTESVITAISVAIHILLLTKISLELSGGQNDFKKLMLRKISKESEVPVKFPDAKVGMKYRVIYSRLTEHMEKKKPYLSEGYTLEELAKELFTNRNYISNVINVCMKKNFNRYINDLRVHHAIGLFKENCNLRLKELAQMSGFHSTVSFNMAFKLLMDTTPGAWCREWREGAPKPKDPSNPKA